MRTLAIALLAACGGAGKGGGAQACLPIAPMKLVVLEHGREWEPLAELRSDGAITRNEGELQTLARIVGNDLRTRDDKPMLSCRDRTLFVDGRAMAKFDAQDRFVDSDGSLLYLDDSGTVHWMRRGKDILGESRFEGAWASAKRTALVIVIATLAGGRAF